jgi:chemotaxis protein methyltransferase CheR
MIYFDKPTQQTLIERLSECLEDGGYLLIGHSESLNNIAHGLDYVCPATYRKPGRTHSGQIERG